MSALLYREITLDRPERWSSLVAFVKANAQACIEAGHPLRLIVTSEEKKRNAEQNRRYWGFLLKQISEQAWVNGRRFNADVWHEFFCSKWAVHEDVELPNGNVIVRRKSTTQMTVAEFSNFMNEVEAYAASELEVTFHD